MEDIGIIAQELKDEWNITTDRILLQQLGITSEVDKKKLFAWIKYQCAFSYNEGYENGQDSKVLQFKDLMNLNR